MPFINRLITVPSKGKHTMFSFDLLAHLDPVYNEITMGELDYLPRVGSYGITTPEGTPGKPLINGTGWKIHDNLIHYGGPDGGVFKKK